MSRERMIGTRSISEGEDQFNYALRPTRLQDYIGQLDIIAKLQISLQATKKREESLEHVLLHGPPGLGKTTLSHIIASEMKSKLVAT